LKTVFNVIESIQNYVEEADIIEICKNIRIVEKPNEKKRKRDEDFE
jgi:uncharacterized protein YqgV (UPF0045/DUF77 family)